MTAEPTAVIPPLITRQRRILIVDDDATNRLVLTGMLKKMGHLAITAENGVEAIEKHLAENPDMVLMDVMMPVMDGYEATRRIKAATKASSFTPVIFLTAITEDTALSRCIEFGGDDFLTKPLNYIILKAKIDALLRVQTLYSELNQHKLEIERHHARLLQEHDLANEVFSKITRWGAFDMPHIRYLVKPQSVTCGDVLLVNRNEYGSEYLLLGDFTGHGLSAAIGAIPTSDIFYPMSSKGLPIGMIAHEINNRLKNTLPTGLYLAATLIEINAGTGIIKVWNGGVPDLLIKSPDGSIDQFRSSHLPLGILNDDDFDASTAITIRPAGTQIFAYTDGIVDATNLSGITFEAILHSTIQRSEREHCYQDLILALDQHLAGINQEDDISLAVFSLNDPPETSSSPINKKLNDWSEHLHLGQAALKKFDVIAYLLNEISLLPNMQPHRTNLYLILSELYSNALEHGILGLESNRKSDGDAFYDYYADRERRLAALDDPECFIRITVEFERNETSSSLTITVTNSGTPMTTQSPPSDGADTGDQLHGRGLHLLRQFSDNIRIDPEHNRVTISLTYPYRMS